MGFLLFPAFCRLNICRFVKEKLEGDDDGDDEEEEKYTKKEEDEDDANIIELKFGIDEEEAELEKEIMKAKMQINEELFEEDEADNVDLDDLE